MGKVGGLRGMVLVMVGGLVRRWQGARVTGQGRRSRGKWAKGVRVNYGFGLGSKFGPL